MRAVTALVLGQTNCDILQLFYNSVVSSVWKYCISAWGGNAMKGDIERISTSINKASKLVNSPQETFMNSYEKVVISKSKRIRDDTSHPFHEIFSGLLNERSGRMRLPFASTNRHRLSFVPQSAKLHNRDFKR